jgi:hypothetical protein
LLDWGNIVGFEREGSMRLISFSATIWFALLSSAALAQQPPGTAGETIGRPPPIAGPPPITEPSTAPPAAAPTPQASQPVSGSNTYKPAELPPVHTGPGRDVEGPDGTTKIVKAVPCGKAAHETDGFTTCIGIFERKNRR